MENIEEDVVVEKIKKELMASGWDEVSEGFWKHPKLLRSGVATFLNAMLLEYKNRVGNVSESVINEQVTQLKLDLTSKIQDLAKANNTIEGLRKEISAKNEVIKQNNFELMQRNEKSERFYKKSENSCHCSGKTKDISNSFISDINRRLSDLEKKNNQLCAFDIPSRVLALEEIFAKTFKASVEFAKALEYYGE